MVADRPGEPNGSSPDGAREGTSDGTPTGVPPALGAAPLPDGLVRPVTDLPEPEDPDATSPDLSSVPSESAVVRLEGGTVSVAGSVDQVHFLWAIAQPGYASDILYGPEPNQLVVVFSNGVDQSVLAASWVEEELILDVFEGVL